MDIEKDVERGECANVQTKNSRTEKNGKKLMKKIYKNYMIKENFGKGIIKILYVGHFIVNDGKEVEVASLHPIKP